MSGYAELPRDLSASSVEVFLAATTSDQVATGSPFTSDTIGVRARWPGSALQSVWNNTLIEVGTLVFWTSRTSRIRGAVVATVAGTATIERSSGSTADEEFNAFILGGGP